MAKEKKSFIRRFFKFLLILVFVVVLAAVGVGLFAYFKYGVKPISLFSNIKQLNKQVKIEEVVSYKYTNDDLNMANLRVSELSTKSVVKFSDAELTAYIDNNFVDEYEFNVKLGKKSYNLKDYDVDICQIKFWESDSGLVDVDFVIRINLTKIKDNKFSKFPASMFKNMLPDTAYVTCGFTLSQVDAGFKIDGKSVRLNTLKDNQSVNVLNAVKMLTGIDTTKLCQSLSQACADIILSDDGFFGALKDAGATDNTFEKQGEQYLFDVYTVDTTETRTITYNNTKGATNPNKTTFTIKDNIITLADLQADGYNFEGWYVHGTNTKKLQIDASDFKNYEFDARWSTISYTITIDLRGGATTSPTTIEYNIETPDFNLPTNLQKIVGGDTLQLKGYIGTDVPVCTKDVTISQGSIGNREFKAYYEGEEVSITLDNDGIEVATMEIDRGGMLSFATFNPADYGMGGYSVKAWYKDSAKTTLFDFTKPITEDITIYGEWTYISDNISFYPYLSQFDAAQTSNNITITSRDMLVAYMDYVTFFNVTNDNVELRLNYVSHTQAAMQAEISGAYNDVFKTKPHFTSGSSGFSFGYTNTFVKFYINTNDMVNAPTLEFTDASYIKQGQEYSLKLNVTPTRAENFDNFNINKVSKTLKVTTSEQLVWALENGYKPTFEEGTSPAKTVYNQAKTVLRTIINDDMDDITKLRAIYEWIIDNTNYDYEAFEKLSTNVIDSSQAKNYYAWYAEGVFEKHRVVCEGYAKAFLIMAQIENIPTVIVTGNNHAWNKVYVNGAWYGVDATHGDTGSSLGTKKVEILNYTTFLFTDDYRATDYVADNYKSFKAETNYEYYKNVLYTFETEEFDLEIDDQAEMTLLLKYVKNYVLNNPIADKYYEMEFCLVSENQDNYDTWIYNAKIAAGWGAAHIAVNYSSNKTDDEGKKVYTLFISVA